MGEFEKPWRNFKWDQKSELRKRLEEFTLSNPDVKYMKILVAGQIGAGKSSFINSVNSVFQGWVTSDAPTISASSHEKSFTKTLKGYNIGRGRIPLIFDDIMGLEAGLIAGSQTEDIINAVYGHVKDGYKFDASQPLTFKDQHFVSDPSLSDQAFCLVYVIAADSISFAKNNVIDKMKIIRHRISDKGIPQVIVMTKVDEACPLVNKDLKKIYYSKKIKEKMQLCSDKVGVPMNYIFPVKNYQNETNTNDDVDVLILKALEQIIQLGDDTMIDRDERKEEMGGSESKPAVPACNTGACNTELDTPWRNFKWDQKSELKKRLEDFSLCNPDVKHIKILVVGQIGAGKSSFINTVNSVFQGWICSDALASSSSGQSKSFTTALKGYHISCGKVPLVFVDIMGLDSKSLAGSHPEDIINAGFGHVKDGYKFDESKPLTHKDQHFVSDPSLSDQAFCLVYVVAADTIHMADNKLIDKIKIIRHRISEKGIPQVIVMTKVDEACPLVKKDVKKIYYSKTIKEQMQMCCDKVGVPMNNIFPVKNYHDEIDTDDDVDVLILKALHQIVQLANNRLFRSTGTL